MSFAAPLTFDDIHKIFKGPTAQIPITLGYRLRLLGLVVGLIFLQFLYVLLIAVAAAATCFLTIITIRSGIPINFVTIAVYLIPPIVGGIATLFLLKPIFSRTSAPIEMTCLSRETEPILFEFVNRLSQMLGAPCPSKIYVDLKPNAAASVSGWRGFFRGEVELTIGLPFAIGLTLPQFTGVLAHEFGHFAQRTGLRSFFLIQKIQHWFSRVVYERDHWDDWLQEREDSGDWRIKIGAHIATLAVTCSRKYLALLMKAGNWLTSSFSQQMEFDADLYEASIVGADTFEETSLRLPVLFVGDQLAWQSANQGWSINCLPQDMADLVANRSQCLTDESVENILKEALAQTTSGWDSHPSLTDRIANVRAKASKIGLLQLEGSPSQLFKDLPALSHKVTLYHYEAIASLPLERIRFSSTAEITLHSAFNFAAEELFHGSPTFWSRWFQLPVQNPQEHPDSSQPPADISANVAQNGYDYSAQTNSLHFTALKIRKAGVSVQTNSFRLVSTDIAKIEQQEAESADDFRKLISEYRETAMRFAQYLENAVARLVSRESVLVLNGIDPAMIPDPHSTWNVYGALAHHQDLVFEIRRMIEAHQTAGENASLFQAALLANLLDELEKESLQMINQVLRSTAAVRLNVSEESRTIATCLSEIDGIGIERVRQFVSRFDSLASIALAQLAWLAANAQDFTEPPAIELRKIPPTY